MASEFTLILPHAIALSRDDARAIREFAAAGGTVIADVQPGVFDAHSRQLSQPLLDTSVLRMISPNELDLSALGVTPRVAIEAPDGDVTSHIWQHGKDKIIGVQRDFAPDASRGTSPMPKIDRTDPGAILSKAVRVPGFVYLQGVTAKDTTKGIKEQTADVLDQIDQCWKPTAPTRRRLLQALIWVRHISDRDGDERALDAVAAAGSDAPACRRNSLRRKSWSRSWSPRANSLGLVHQSFRHESGLPEFLRVIAIRPNREQIGPIRTIVSNSDLIHRVRRANCAANSEITSAVGCHHCNPVATNSQSLNKQSGLGVAMRGWGTGAKTLVLGSFLVLAGQFIGPHAQAGVTTSRHF